LLTGAMLLAEKAAADRRVSAGVRCPRNGRGLRGMAQAGFVLGCPTVCGQWRQQRRVRRGWVGIIPRTESFSGGT